MTKHHSDSQIMVFTLPWTYYTNNWEKQRFHRLIGEYAIGLHRLILMHSFTSFNFNFVLVVRTHPTAKVLSRITICIESTGSLWTL